VHTEIERECVYLCSCVTDKGGQREKEREGKKEKERKRERERVEMFGVMHGYVRHDSLLRAT